MRRGGRGRVRIRVERKVKPLVVKRVGEGGGWAWFSNFFFEYLDPHLLRYCSKGVPLLSMVVCLAYNNKIHIF